MSDATNLIFKQIPAGPMDNFQYFVGDRSSGEVGLVDPAWDIDRMFSLAEKDDVKITAVLLTHTHYDHVKELGALLLRADVPVYVSKYEADGIDAPTQNVRKTKDKETIEIGSVKIECLHTPGHTPGGQCYKVGNFLITGDTMFIDGCGRCDLAGGNAKEMYNSLYNVIAKLPDETIIYPGHDYGSTPFATLESQKNTNPYLMTDSLEDFLYRRM